MSTSISFHSVLDEKKIQRIGYNSQPMQAMYTNDEYEEVEMQVELIEGQEKAFQIVDPKVNWDPTINDLHISQLIQITNPSFLFGPNGVASEDAVLGIAYKWYSKDSSQIKVEPVKEFSKEEVQSLSSEITTVIPKGTLRGKITFEVVLYLSRYKNNSGMLLTKPGTILGLLESQIILLDGNSSMFPIVEVNDPSKPLWWVKCDFIDPLYEQFREENVAIVINQAHKLARQLKIENGLGSSALLIEIIATSLQIILEKTKLTGEWESILNGESEQGSIGEAIYYFISTFGWDVSSPEKLAKSIREDFENRFK